MIDENFTWDSNYGDTINNPFISYGVNEEIDEVEVEVVVDIPEIVEVKEGVASTSQRPQRARVLPARLQDCEVVGDDEVTPDGDFVHFALLAGDEPINYRETLKDKQWKEFIVEEFQVIERNNTWELVELPAYTRQD